MFFNPIHYIHKVSWTTYGNRSTRLWTQSFTLASLDGAITPRQLFRYGAIRQQLKWYRKLLGFSLKKYKNRMYSWPKGLYCGRTWFYIFYLYGNV